MDKQEAMEPIGEVAQRMMGARSLPSQTSRRSSLPEGADPGRRRAPRRRDSGGQDSRPPEPEEKYCPECGGRIEFLFMDNPLYLKVTGRKPHWSELPCEVCEQKRKEEEEEQRRRELRQARIERLLKNSMLKRRFITKTLDSFIPYGKWKEKQARVLSIAREFAQNFPRHREMGTWMLFMGNVGTGKGHLCAGIVNEVVRSGYTVLFTKTPRLLREIKETFGRNSEVSEKEIFQRFEQIDLLVIDEVGVQFGTLTEQNILFEILDARYEDMLPTILTTNIKDLKTLEDLLGERILDRFYEGSSRIVLFDWESHRRNHRGKDR